MADHTAIEWTDATWNVITGCSVVSPGCTNCYAMRLAGTRLKHQPSRAGLTVDSKAGPVWNGQVRFNTEWLNQPLGWKRPRRIFVCAHGDLFHEGVAAAWLDLVFRVMAMTPRHTYQILTKRPERMRTYLTDPATPGRIAYGGPRQGWPLPNVWLGVSVEDQVRADQRIPILLDTPAAIRWISAEPLLGPINIDDAMWAGDKDSSANLTASLDWVVVGGESGPGSRPMHPDWARALRDQCASTETPFLFKQWGAWGIDQGPAADGRDRIMEGAGPCARLRDGAWETAPDGFSMPIDDTAPGPWLYRLGKKATGRLLDGALHVDYPEPPR